MRDPKTWWYQRIGLAALPAKVNPQVLQRGTQRTPYRAHLSYSRRHAPPYPGSGHHHSLPGSMIARSIRGARRFFSCGGPGTSARAVTMPRNEAAASVAIAKPNVRRGIGRPRATSRCVWITCFILVSMLTTAPPSVIVRDGRA
jgi:hypothetical protein